MLGGRWEGLQSWPAKVKHSQNQLLPRLTSCRAIKLPPTPSLHLVPPPSSHLNAQKDAQVPGGHIGDGVGKLAAAVAGASAFPWVPGSAIRRGAGAAPVFTLDNREEPSLATARPCRQPAAASLAATLHVLREHLVCSSQRDKKEEQGGGN